MGNRMLKWFKSGHLPDHLRAVSQACEDLGKEMDALLPESAEKSAGMRKLLEAKDCFVRAKLEETES